MARRVQVQVQESAVDDSRGEERCGKKMPFKEDVRGNKEVKKKKKSSSIDDPGVLRRITKKQCSNIPGHVNIITV